MEAEEKCPTCNGTGTCECQHYDDVQSCMTCLGTGVLRYRIKEEKAKESSKEREEKLTQCMMGRDAECWHPKCPITTEDMKNGKYCTLPLWDYRQ